MEYTISLILKHIEYVFNIKYDDISTLNQLLLKLKQYNEYRFINHQNKTIVSVGKNGKYLILFLCEDNIDKFNSYPVCILLNTSDSIYKNVYCIFNDTHIDYIFKNNDIFINLHTPEKTLYYKDMKHYYREFSCHHEHNEHNEHHDKKIFNNVINYNNYINKNIIYCDDIDDIINNLVI